MRTPAQNLFHAGASVGLTARERELAGIVAAYNEVTDRLKLAHERLTAEVARLHEELRQKNEALRRQERLAALGEMAAGLAHEIRNPLGGIALYASMLARDLPEGSASATAGKIFHGVRSLEALVREILEFAQEDRLERRPVLLGSILSAIQVGAEGVEAQTSASLQVHATPGDHVVNADSDRLQRALLNLVANGLQAAGPGGWARLAVFSDASEIRFELTDSGAGIPQEALGRIFNPFFTTKNSGTGLGLAICHRIIEAHGGTIHAGNVPGGGAQFVVRLPQDDRALQ